MYSDKENVNILTALLVKQGISHVVVCPGSRNAPLVHNFNECPSLTCHPVTDERSAGFYALGLSLALATPVAVCVTSGTALLNLTPAVAEATYQHRGLVVISADRPQAWIGQLDGQTLPQPGAFGPFVGKSVNLPEACDAESRWHCNRLVNEALVAVRRQGRMSVHINVPVSEPLFGFHVETLPDERAIVFGEAPTAFGGQVAARLAEDFCRARKPMIVLGQNHAFGEEDLFYIDQLKRRAVVLHEPLAHPEGGIPFDEVLHRAGADSRYLPDFLLYCGDTVVSKCLKMFLRKGVETVWEITEDGQIHDTFMCVKAVCQGDARAVLHHLGEMLAAGSLPDTLPKESPAPQDTSAYVGLWQSALAAQKVALYGFEPAYSQMAAVKLFEDALLRLPLPGIVHYANSTAVRLANVYARHYVYCNRGVNGIEGSLSTAAGHSLAVDCKVFIVIGDLSFFYDSNALWNQELRGNFRILLLNNGRGGIFGQLRGLEQSPARDPYVAAAHTATAEGLCRSYGVDYLCARDMAELREAMPRLLGEEARRPLLLEVFTDAAEDIRVLKAYYNLIK